MTKPTLVATGLNQDAAQARMTDHLRLAAQAYQEAPAEMLERAAEAVEPIEATEVAQTEERAPTGSLEANAGTPLDVSKSGPQWGKWETSSSLVTVAPPEAAPVAQVLFNDVRLKHQGFDQSLTMLEAERDSVLRKYDDDMAELSSKWDTRLADLDKRIADHELARNMTLGAIDVYEKASGK